MVTNHNINYAITAFSSDGTVDKQRAITIGAIKGTLFGFLIILVVSWLLLFWRQRKHEETIEEKEMEAEYDYDYGSLISDDDESQDTFIVSPTRYSMRLANKKDDHQGTELEMDSIGGYWEEESSPRKSSLRLALKKHQGLGLEWEDSGERHSCRLADQHSES
ncbi:MAG: hypothetical protein SGBAC_001770 [Bacillariaceae sp.]